MNLKPFTFRPLIRIAVGSAAFLGLATSLHAAAYQDAVIALQPDYYFELNETDPTEGIVDTMGNVAPGVLKGNYTTGDPEIGAAGPDFLLFDGAWDETAWDPNTTGLQIPIVGLGANNTAHASNNAGHIDIGDSDLFGAPTMTVAMFARGGPAQGGDRLFTNNLADPTRSFQIVVGNDGLVVSVDPSDECVDVDTCKHRSLFFPEQGGEGKSNEGADRGLNNADNGWWHIVASTTGETSQERADNIRLWLNGVDRTEDMKPGTVGWGRDTDTAKIGGRRGDPTDSTTHSGAQDEVAIWLQRDPFTTDEALSLFNAAITPVTGLDCDFDNSSLCDLADIDALLDAVGTNNADFDLDNDGTVGEGDIEAWLTSAGSENLGRPYLNGDATLDGTVDASDLNVVGINWQSSTANSWAEGDFTGDKNVNAQDLNVLGVNWQQSAPLASAVPEPSGMVIALCGLLFLWRRK